MQDDDSSLPVNEPPGPKASILLVDDQQANLLALTVILEVLGHHLIEAASGEEALRRVLERDFAVILLDVKMLGLDGFETAKLIRNRRRSRHTPILFLTAYEDNRLSVEEAYSLGAVDYLVKPLVPVILRAKVRGFVELYQKTEQIKHQAEQLRQLERGQFETILAEENARLRQSEARKAAVLETSLDAILSMDHAGKVVEFNPAAERMFGYQRTEILGRDMADLLIPPSYREAYRRGLAHYLTTGISPILGRRVEMTARRADGTEFPIELAIVRIPTNGPPLFIGHARDITERVGLEKELRARQEREWAILNNTTAVIYVKGVDGRYQFVNQRHADLFSQDPATVIGKTGHDLYPKEIADALARNDRHVLETRETTSSQEVVPHADGNHTYISVKVPLFDAKGEVTAVAGISTDITDQLRAREADEEMRLARVFQQKLYPARAPSVAGLDVAGSALPVSQVCGDYFDYVLRSEHRLAVSLGDVSGHGFGPALQMVEVRATIRILLREAAPLHQVVEELNRVLCVDLPESSFVSLFLAEIDAESRELRYVGAGHQAFLRNQDGRTMTLESTGPLLGIDDSACFPEPASIPLVVGDVLVLFTDGLTEAMNLAGEQFGMRRLVETVNRHHQEPSQAVLLNLFAAIYDFAKGRTLQDDMTAITVKIVN